MRLMKSLSCIAALILLAGCQSQQMIPVETLVPAVAPGPTGYKAVAPFFDGMRSEKQVTTNIVVYDVELDQGVQELDWGLSPGAAGVTMKSPKSPVQAWRQGTNSQAHTVVIAKKSQGVLEWLSKQGKMSFKASAVLVTLDGMRAPLGTKDQLGYLEQFQLGGVLIAGTVTQSAYLDVLPMVIDDHNVFLDMKVVFSTSVTSHPTPDKQHISEETRSIQESVVASDSDLVVISGPTKPETVKGKRVVSVVLVSIDVK
jgi:hypothetical protein